MLNRLIEEETITSKIKKFFKRIKNFLLRRERLPKNVFIIKEFDNFVAFFSFIGSGTYIGLYSVLMYKSSRTSSYRGPSFRKALSFFGFATTGMLIVLLLSFQPIIEWILTIQIIIWIFITSIHLLAHKFINLPINQIRRLDTETKLTLFQDLFAIIKRLNINDRNLIDSIEDDIRVLEERKIRKI